MAACSGADLGPGGPACRSGKPPPFSSCSRLRGGRSEEDVELLWSPASCELGTQLGFSDEASMSSYVKRGW